MGKDADMNVNGTRGWTANGETRVFTMYERDHTVKCLYQ